MKRWKKLLLILLALLLVSQIPFAYRRYKLGRLSAAIQVINASRKFSETNSRYTDYKGVAHVHSFLGGHSSGTFSEIISAAQSNQLQFVIMTEHVEKDFSTSEMSLQGTHAGVLFVNGNEVSTASGDRLLVIPGDSSLSTADKLPTAEVAKTAKDHKSVVVIAYPEQFKGWGEIASVGLDPITSEHGPASGYGVEVYNVYTNARQVNPIVALFDVLWSERSYPDLLFATFYKRPNEALARWDQASFAANSAGKPGVTATAGNDAHANVGISLNDSTGKTLMGIKLDPYETSFHLVRLHVLIPQSEILTTKSLLEAIAAGHCYIGFDIFGETSGFNFTAETPAATKIQGDEATLERNIQLNISTPASSRIVLFKDGSVIADESEVSNKKVGITEPGVYRVEVYLPQLGKPVGDQPWIISNPIYVR